MTAELKKDNDGVFIYFGGESRTDVLDVAKNIGGKSDDAGKNDDFDSALERFRAQGVKKITAKVVDAAKFSSLTAAEIFFYAKKIRNAGFEFDYDGLEGSFKDVLKLALQTSNVVPQENLADNSYLARIGKFWYQMYMSTKNALSFCRDAFVSVLRLFSGRAIFRGKDFFMIFAECSYKAVGIISLASFLVGLILAFVGALQLRTFGAGIYVASMVSLGMTRIMAAIMTGIIMAGRTGASFAATLGTMQANEETDALKTLGIRVTDYLAAPRIASLVLSIPFLTMLADFLGILGGAAVGVFFLDLSAPSYFDYAIKALSLKNILVGLLHSVVYGIIISLAGCYAGLYAGRDADSVGKATTSAVVTALVGMIVATGILTVILEELGI